MKKFYWKPLFMMCFVLLLTNCQKEDLENEVVESANDFNSFHTSFNFEEANFHDFEALPDLYRTIIEEKKKSFIAATSKEATLYDFNIIEDNVYEITNAHGTFYTMAIVRGEEVRHSFENLVIAKKRDQEPKAYLYEYFPTQGYLDNLSNHKKAYFEGKRKITPLNYNDISFNRISCFTTTTTYCNWGGEEHFAGGNCTASYMYSRTTTTCTEDNTEHFVNTDNNDGGSTGSGSGGGGTPPPPPPPADEDPDTVTGPNICINCPPVELDSFATSLIDILDITNSDKIEWMFQNPVLMTKIYDRFLEDGQTEEAKILAALSLEVDFKDFTVTWTPVSQSNYMDREALTYNRISSSTIEGHTFSMYRLLDGNIIGVGVNYNHEDGSSKHFYYDRDSATWYSYRLPSISYENTDLDFLIEKFWDSIKFAARYATPLEEFVVLIDGKDFDGIDASKLESGVFLVIGFIPGGKILKPVTKIVKGTRIASVIIKSGDDIINLSYKYVGDIIEFGNRSKLGKVMKTLAGEEAHHIIPWGKRLDKVIQKAALDGFHMNAKVNGKNLKKFSKLTGEGLHGNHPAYDKYVQKRLEGFKDEFLDYDAEQARHFLENELIPDLDDYIEAAKTSNLNLNEYFKQVVNPSIGLN